MLKCHQRELALLLGLRDTSVTRVEAECADLTDDDALDLLRADLANRHYDNYAISCALLEDLCIGLELLGADVR